MSRTLSTTAHVGEVDVEVDVDDLLRELDDDDLIQELRDRGLGGPVTGIEYAYQCLLRRDLNGALAALEPLVHPRFPSSAAAEAVYKKVMAEKKEPRP